MPSICEVSGCGAVSVGKGLCNKHRQRYARHGDVEAGRPAGWGKGHGHPLYERWRSMRRTAKLAGGCVPEWAEFQRFVVDVGAPPSATHRLYRLNDKLPFGPKNITWRERLQGAPAGKTREERNAYMREFTKKRPLLRKAQYLKRHYGVSIEWYEAQSQLQGDRCAICHGVETRCARASGEPFMLAVDHDHKTGSPRALLCSDCNHGLGNFADSVDRLRAAIAYLEKHAPIDS